MQINKSISTHLFTQRLAKSQKKKNLHNKQHNKNNFKISCAQLPTHLLRNYFPTCYSIRAIHYWLYQTSVYYILLSDDDEIDDNMASVPALIKKKIFLATQRSK